MDERNEAWKWLCDGPVSQAEFVNVVDLYSTPSDARFILLYVSTKAATHSKEPDDSSSTHLFEVNIPIVARVVAFVHGHETTLDILTTATASSEVEPATPLFTMVDVAFLDVIVDAARLERQENIATNNAINVLDSYLWSRRGKFAPPQMLALRPAIGTSSKDNNNNQRKDGNHNTTSMNPTSNAASAGDGDTKTNAFLLQYMKPHKQQQDNESVDSDDSSASKYSNTNNNNNTNEPRMDMGHRFYEDPVGHWGISVDLGTNSTTDQLSNTQQTQKRSNVSPSSVSSANGEGDNDRECPIACVPLRQGVRGMVTAVAVYECGCAFIDSLLSEKACPVCYDRRQRREVV